MQTFGKYSGFTLLHCFSLLLHRYPTVTSTLFIAQHRCFTAAPLHHIAICHPESLSKVCIFVFPSVLLQHNVRPSLDPFVTIGINLSRTEAEHLFG